MQTITIEAKSAAAFATELLDMPHETRATVIATENGSPWATVDVSPMTDTQRAVFPNYPTETGGFRGDTRKRGQSGVMVSKDKTPVLLVIERARRMARP